MNRDKLKAYEIVREEELPDIHSKGTILRHKKTGARVMCIENDDENKVFNIAFRTPSKNSTGVAHIMEHSVLCGSREFPLKDPFVELVKGSLNTFLNAMTYPDKTCYPVASCNDQDFQNLIHVYLDAVFYPNIYSKEEIFRQEGWHYHLEDPEGPLTYNGVVYNEMKGAFSSPDEVLEREIMNSLFPDTIYGVESGGDPEVIPELTYEAFLDFHRTFYHPSNSFIYLYGNMDMCEKLDYIDEHYLSAFDALDVDSVIRKQLPFEKMAERKLPYPVAETDSEEDNTYLSFNKVIDDGADSILCLAFGILDYVLLSAPGAVLKKALLDARLAKDVYGSFEDGILQPYFTIVAKGSNEDRREEFLEIIRRVLTEVTENGINQKAVEAAINFMEFRYREADFSSYPKGLMYGLDILGDWIYSDEKPFAQVQQLAAFEHLKKAAKEGYFEDLIRKYLLENPHGCILTLVPQKGLAGEREKALAEKLESYRRSLPAEELEKMVERTRKLEEYQESEEDPENLNCIPMLKRSDIRKEVAPLSNQAYDIAGNLFLYHDVVTNGIGYLDLMFRITTRNVEQIHYLGLLKSVLGYVDTEHYTYGELFNEINRGSGGLSCGIELFENISVENGFSPMFSVKGKALYSQMGFLFEMVREILETSVLEDTGRLYEIVAEVKSRAQASMVGAGHATAVLRASSYGSVNVCFQDEMAGIGYYKFIEDLEKHFEEKKEDLVKNLRLLMKMILRPENLSVSYTGEKESLDEVMRLFGQMKEYLCRETVEDARNDLEVEKKNEGFSTSGQVQYVAQCGNFLKKGLAYTGALEILKVILSYDYLWINLRVKGGAYGCMSGFKRNGEGYFVSYRDPHLRRTLEVFRGIPDYVRTFDADEREMTKYIIGTISGKDVPRTPQMQGNISKTAYFSGITEKELQEERDQILNAGVEDIRALSDIVEAILSDKAICVVGSESALQKAEGELKEIRPLVGEG